MGTADFEPFPFILSKEEVEVGNIVTVKLICSKYETANFHCVEEVKEGLDYSLLLLSERRCPARCQQPVKPVTTDK